MKYTVTQKDVVKYRADYIGTHTGTLTNDIMIALQVFVDTLPEPHPVGPLVATEEMAAKMIARYRNTWPGYGCNDAVAVLDMLNAALSVAPWADYTKELAEKDVEIASLKRWGEQSALAVTQPLQERIAELEHKLSYTRERLGLRCEQIDNGNPHADLEKAVVDAAVKVRDRWVQMYEDDPRTTFHVTACNLSEAVDNLEAARRPKTRTEWLWVWVDIYNNNAVKHVWAEDPNEIPDGAEKTNISREVTL